MKLNLVKIEMISSYFSLARLNFHKESSHCAHSLTCLLLLSILNSLVSYCSLLIRDNLKIVKALSAGVWLYDVFDKAIAAEINKKKKKSFMLSFFKIITVSTQEFLCCCCYTILLLKVFLNHQ